jgi:hypothetical protein
MFNKGFYVSLADLLNLPLATTLNKTQKQPGRSQASPEGRELAVASMLMLHILPHVILARKIHGRKLAQNRF